MPVPKGRRCENCRYAMKSDSPEAMSQGNGRRFELWCLRYPPNSDGSWPQVHAGHWCGEHAPARPKTISEGAAVLARMVLLGDLTAAWALADKLLEDKT